MLIRTTEAGKVVIGFCVLLATGVASCDADSRRRRGSRDDAGEAGENDGAGMAGVAGSGRAGSATANGGTSAGTSSGVAPECAELATCCVEASGDAQVACELSVDAGDPANCLTALLYFRESGLCVEGGSGGSGAFGGGAGTGTGGGASGGQGGAAAGTTGKGGASGDSSGGTGALGTSCPNLALGATATAQTTYSGYSPARVVDGDTDTSLGGASSWANDWVPPDITYPQWFEIELTEAQTIARVEVYTTDDYRISQYDLSYRGESDWVPLQEVSGNTAVHLVHEFAPVETDALRFVVRSGPSHQTNHSRFNEIEIYGPADSCVMSGSQ